jgi:dTDP-4-amino-4,6-dideoxygalactose transaminase
LPSYTFVSSANAFVLRGGIPVFVDVHPETLNINEKLIESAITSKTRAIIPVHYAGEVGRLDDVYKFAKKHNLRVIEDAAHAFGTKYKGNVVGSFGDIVCFSFDGIKNITAGEGGAIVTNDQLVLARVRQYRLLGVMKDTEKRFLNDRSWEFDVQNQGWRYHMSDIMAAIGIQQLKRFNKFSKI